MAAAASRTELESLVGALPSACAPAGFVTGDVAFAPAWEPGIERNLRAWTSTDRPDDDIPDGAFATYDITLTVTATTETGWEFEWATDQLGLEGMGIPDWALDAFAAEIGDLLTPAVRYRMDELGIIEELLNGDELFASVLETLDRIGEADPTAAETADILRTIDPATLEVFFLEEPSVYHFFDNVILSIDGPETFDDELANAFGGAPFPAVTTIEPLPRQDGDECLGFLITTEPDPEQFGSILLETLANVFGEVPPEEELSGGDWRIVNETIVRLDAVTGLVSSVVADQTVAFDGMVGTERLVIVDVTESLSE